MIKLSIIIPAYNAEPYLKELIECLRQQITNEVEVIIVDDGSKEKVSYKEKWFKVVRTRNRGAGAARNKGIELAKGEYISFIDADDLVAQDFIAQVLKKIEESPFDVCDVSWKSLNREGVQFNMKLSPGREWLENCSACTRIFSREFIGDNRFTEIKDATEDEDFSRKVGYLDKDRVKHHTFIPEYMYFYRTYVADSKSKIFKKGLMRTKRIVYYYPVVTADMTDVVKQIRLDDLQHEVWLLTNRCDIPELKKWCQIHRPFHIWTHYLKGEPYSDCEVIQVPHHSQVVLYINNIHIIGGIETFIYSFCEEMGKYYDITYVVNKAPKEHVREMEKVTTVIWNQPNRQITCDTLIMLRILDTIPNNITFKKSIQMCHACKTSHTWHIPQDSDYIVTVSETSKESFGDEGKEAAVIHNLISMEHKKPLVLMSATRIPAPDKGANEKRMRQLAGMLENAGIEYLWLNFSEGSLPDAPKGFHNMGLVMKASDYFPMADYIVQLSDSEAWSYTVLESLTQNIPVIVTPFPSGAEMGIVDGVNGYVVPFDMDFDVNKLLNKPTFSYEYDTNRIVKQWKKIIDAKPPKIPKARKNPNLRNGINTKQESGQIPINGFNTKQSNIISSTSRKMTKHDSESSRQQQDKEMRAKGYVKVKVNCKYKDMALNEWLRPGMIRWFTKERAEMVSERGYVRIMEG